MKTSVVLALRGDVGNELTSIAVQSVRLDAGGVVSRVATNLAVDVPRKFFFAFVGSTQPALLRAVLQAVRPVFALGGFGARVGARGIRNRDPFIGILAVIQKAAGETVHGHIRKKRVFVVVSPAAAQDSVVFDAAGEHAGQRGLGGGAADEERGNRLHRFWVFTFTNWDWW